MLPGPFSIAVDSTQSWPGVSASMPACTPEPIDDRVFTADSAPRSEVIRAAPDSATSSVGPNSAVDSNPDTGPNTGDSPLLMRVVPKGYPHIHRLIHNPSQPECLGKPPGPLIAAHPICPWEGSNDEVRPRWQLTHEGGNPVTKTPAHSATQHRIANNLAHSKPNLWRTLSTGYPQREDSGINPDTTATPKRFGDIGTAGEAVLARQHGQPAALDAQAKRCSVRLRGGCGPWHDGRREPHDRHGYACEDGSRGSWPGGGCSAGTSACSRRSPRSKVRAGTGRRRPMPEPEEKGKAEHPGPATRGRTIGTQQSRHTLVAADTAVAEVVVKLSPPILSSSTDSP